MTLKPDLSTQKGRFKSFLNGKIQGIKVVNRAEKMLKSGQKMDAFADQRLLTIIKQDVIRLRALIREVRDRRITKPLFEIPDRSWKIKNTSTQKEIHIEFLLSTKWPPCNRALTIIKSEHVENPFMEILKTEKVRKKIEHMEKKYGVKFVFTCKSR